MSTEERQHTWFSFDLDYTLIRYKDSLHRLIFDCTVRYLVECAEYPASLSEEKFEDWQKYVAKGLIIDEAKGLLVQLDKKKRVVNALRGKTSLTKEEIKKEYGKSCTLSAFEGKSDPGLFFSLVTGFEMPLGALYPLVTSMIGLDKGEHNSDEFLKVCKDFRDALNFNFLNWEGNGWFFPELRANPLEYFEKRDSVRTWLKHLKDDLGHRVMMITNSMPQYTELLMTYAYGDDWKKLFDIVLVRAAKPFFFMEAMCSEPKRRPFIEYVWDKGYVESSEPVKLQLSQTSCYSEGNAQDLISFLKADVHDENDFHVLYFGDHMVGDVRAPRLANWKTVAIIEELEHQELHGSSWVHSRTIQAKRDSSALKKVQSDLWSPYLTGDDGATFWGAWAQSHADVIIPCLTDLKDEDLHDVLVVKKLSGQATEKKCIVS